MRIVFLLLSLAVWLPDGRDLCAVKWGLDHRNVKQDMKQEVMARQGLPVARLSHYEIDHIVPRELGGLDEVENLQAQCCIVNGVIRGQAHNKDVVENRLHRLVCAGEVALEDAQAIFRQDPTGALAITTYPRKVKP